MKNRLRYLLIVLVFALSAAVGPVQNALATPAPVPALDPVPPVYEQWQTQIVSLPGGTLKSPPANWLLYVRQLIRGAFPVGMPWYVKGLGWVVKVGYFVKLPVVPLFPRRLLCNPYYVAPGCPNPNVS